MIRLEHGEVLRLDQGGSTPRVRINAIVQTWLK
jgi:hypothetical protein